MRIMSQARSHSSSSKRFSLGIARLYIRRTKRPRAGEFTRRSSLRWFIPSLRRVNRASRKLYFSSAAFAQLLRFSRCKSAVLTRYLKCCRHDDLHLLAVRWESRYSFLEWG